MYEAKLGSACLFLMCLALLSVASGGGAGEVTVPEATTVYHTPGKKRCHVVGCRRLTKDPKELEAMTRMTLAEAEAKGISPCSRCPVPAAKPAGGAKTADAATAADAASSNMVAYYVEGKKRCHVVGCRRLTTDPEELAKMKKTTLAEAEAMGLPRCSRCPGSTTPRAENAKDGADTVAGDTVAYYVEGKKRCHIVGCRRLTTDPEELAKMKKTTLAQAEAMGLPPCSRCPGSTTPGKGNPGGGKSGLPESWVNPPREDVRRAEFKPDPRSPLVSLGADGKLVYTPYTDKGDRIIDFSYAGFKQSEEPIPAVPTVVTLAPPAGEAKPQGKMKYPVGINSHRLIQEALNKVAAREPDADGFRGAVLLKRGTWHLNGGLQVRSGVVLRGEGDGEDGTVLLFTIPEGNGVGVQLGDGGGTKTTDWTFLTGTVSQETNEAGKEQFFLTLDDGSKFGMRTPRGDAGWKLDDYVGQKVTLKFSIVISTQGLSRNVTLRKTFPYEVQAVKPGQAVPAPHPELVLPGQDEEARTVDAPAVKITDAYIPSGSNQVTVADAGAFRAGDTVKVVKTTNEKWIEVLGVGERLRHIRGGKEGAGKRPWGPGAYGHERRITAVEDNTLTLDVMLPQSIDAEHGGGTVQKIAPSAKASLCGVEHLRIVSNYDASVTSNDKSANYGNLKNGVGMDCVDSWVRNCTVLHVWFAAVTPGSSAYSTVRDCKGLQPVGPVRGGKRYTYSIGGGTGILVYNCYAEDGRHDFAVGARTSGPNAFVKCTALRGGQSEPHHRWGVGTLYDSITLKESGSIAAINRGDSGSGHGWAAANTVIWNCAAQNIVVFDPETEGENNFAIGYTGPRQDEYSTDGLKYANTRAGYWGTPQEGVYYGYALMGNGYIESPDKPVSPGSLFEQQLIGRIGKAQAQAVLE